MKEIQFKNTAVLIFVAITIGILFFLPNHAIDPWQLFNPRLFGILILTFVGIQLFGYLAIRLFGQYFGIAVMGLLGGFISSTAVFANLPHTLKNYPHHERPIQAAGLLSNVAMLISTLVILLIASKTFFEIAFWPIFSMIIMSMSIAIFLLILHQSSNHIGEKKLPTFNFLSVIFTALFIGAILIIITIVRRYLGSNAVLYVSFLSGLFEIHSVTFATSILYRAKQINIHYACYALGLAILATYVSKIILVWSLMPTRFALKSSFYLFFVAITGSLVFLLIG